VRFRFNKNEWENFKKSKNARFHVDWKGFREKIKFNVNWKSFRENFKLKFDIDWKSLKENKKLKFNIGLVVVLIAFFVIFPDIIISVYRAGHHVEKKPEEKKAVRLEQPRAVPKALHRAQRIKQRAKIRLPKKSNVRVAIILDDAGGKIPDYDEICSIKEPLTISVIPDMPSSGNVAKAMSDAGFEVMLHLPMESLNGNYRTSGGGMINCSESDYEIRKTVLDDLASVRWAVGVNNHMGSKATSDERVMNAVFGALKGSGLFFIDSRTSDRSIAFKLSKNFRIPSAENNIFLDSETGQTYIEANLRRLISMARRNGGAIGIGHATRPMTVSVLKKLMPEYEKDGVDFVYASELVK
jgi:polysaccharide deacetylase 2 family uncharacterized protein YibQ